MSSCLYNNDWKKQFPTYNFLERDIALEEYISSTKNLESEERIFVTASNITLVSFTALVSLIMASTEKISKLFIDILPSYVVSSFLLFFVFAFSIIHVRYFAERQKSILFSSRKIVTLRRMLGLSYGTMRLVLPNWRVEGAEHPLSIRLFPGWFTYVAYPFWILLITSSSICFVLLAVIFNDLSTGVFFINEKVFILGGTLCWIIMLSLFFRASLLDTHENLRLLFSLRLAKFLKLPMVDNVEYTIYKAIISKYETECLKVKIDSIKDFLLFIEDKNFLKHSGVSYKGIVRAILGILRLRNKSGGSTIHQQLIRTLFISDLKKRKRRKIIEMIMAKWLDDSFDKSTILDIYISSVRFENHCFGIVSAMNFYWGEVRKEVTPAQAFFLIERVSNIRSSLLVDKIIATALSARKENLLSTKDLDGLAVLYRDGVKFGKIKAQEEDILRLTTALTQANKII
ncbi:biosynthetic peptidoglycan transglycosylase [Vibrio sp. HENC-03]|uniref:biosynthetic peptidoglycan transglycosylase n=1 Tax=Vibrio sp. HENC-03 TaxID=992012 RepID=UPI00028D7AB5|nr:biosynthetic peptidoglycan transglycosylase [Vibrio sp. HENC-03]EKM25008.1 transglycosylase family protein [Vibrio sp. HENC-03]